MTHYNQPQVGAGPWSTQDQRGQWQVGWESKGTAAPGAMKDGNGVEARNQG